MTDRQLLLVDDNPEFRQVLAEFLRRDGFDVVEAEDGRAALERVRKIEPAIVVTDCQMPRMDGATLVDKLHARRPGLPVVVISGEGQSIPRHAVAFFEKGASMARLAARIREVFDRMTGTERARPHVY